MKNHLVLCLISQQLSYEEFIANLILNLKDQMQFYQLASILIVGYDTL